MGVSGQSGPSFRGESEDVNYPLKAKWENFSCAEFATNVGSLNLPDIGPGSFLEIDRNIPYVGILDTDRKVKYRPLPAEPPFASGRHLPEFPLWDNSSLKSGHSPTRQESKITSDKLRTF